MPQFVPVVDDETPLSERQAQGIRAARYAPKPSGKPAVDRGWEQGNVGWGVLGAFGSTEKDEAACSNVFHRSTRDDMKMEKNEKGLWVKSKKKVDSVEHSSAGSMKPMGRGKGISVIDDALGLIPSNMAGRDAAPSLQSYDPDDYVTSSKKRTIASSSRVSSHKSPSRSRSRDRNVRREHGSHRDRDRYRDRSLSRSRDRHRAGDFRRRPRSHSRSLSRSRTHRHSHDDTRRSECSNYDRKKDRERVSDRSPRERRHSRSPRRERAMVYKEEKRYEQHMVGPQEEREENISLNKSSMVSDGESNSDHMCFSFTAVQIVERFLEVFSSSSPNRIDNIAELFAEDAVISSLKNGNVYLQGREKISKSFVSTKPREATVSKRVLIDAPNLLHVPSKITFCIDMHCPQTSPGLGDVSRSTVLLYRCDKCSITNVWGMSDLENLSTRENLTFETFLLSAAWKVASDIISSDIDVAAIVQTNDWGCIHFHNYDTMDVWG